MIDIIVAVNDDEVLGNNLSRSSLLGSSDIILHIMKGYSSAGVAYNSALDACTNDLVVFVHQDVYIPPGWLEKVMKDIAYLDERDSTWAVLGLYGVMKSGQHAGYVWSSGLDNMVGHAFEYPTPVESVDELLIIVKKSSGIRFDDELPGYHLFGTDIVQNSLAGNKGAYVICAPVIHNSRPVLFLNDDYFAAYDYVANKWKDKLPIPNCVMPIVDSKVLRLKMRLRHKYLKLRHSNIDRRSLDKNYDPRIIAKNLGLE